MWQVRIDMTDMMAMRVRGLGLPSSAQEHAAAGSINEQAAVSAPAPPGKQSKPPRVAPPGEQSKPPRVAPPGEQSKPPRVAPPGEQSKPPRVAPPGEQSKPPRVAPPGEQSKPPRVAPPGEQSKPPRVAPPGEQSKASGTASPFCGGTVRRIVLSESGGEDRYVSPTTLPSLLLAIAAVLSLAAEPPGNAHAAEIRRPATHGVPGAPAVSAGQPAHAAAL